MVNRRRGGSGGGRRFVRRRVDVLSQEGIEHVDYKDVNMLRQFTSDLGKIEPRRRNQVSAKHQRSLTLAIKRARHLALIPFVDDGRGRQRDGGRRGGRGGGGGRRPR